MKFFITTPPSSGSNFSYNIVDSSLVIEIPLSQQMLVYQELEVQPAGELVIDGELVVIE